MKPGAFLPVLALALLTWPPAVGEQQQRAAPVPPLLSGTEAQDLVFFHDSRPLFVRLHIHIDGRPFRTSWSEYLDKLFEFLDVNGDGVLAKEELAHAPSPQQLLQQLQGVLAVEPGPAPEFSEVDTAPVDGRVTREELKSYYRRSGLGALQLVLGQRQGNEDALSDVLFALLDRNKDGKLSREELIAAPAVLRPLDLNDDETITVTELLGRRQATGFVFQALLPPEAKTDSSPVELLTAGDSTERLVRRLLGHYDKDHNHRLSRKEVGLDKAAFDRLDRNGDGELDADELAQWPNLEPDLELILDGGTTPAKQAITEVPRSDGQVRPLAAMLRSTRHGALLLLLPGTQIELHINRGKALPARLAAARGECLQKFKALARNGYLDSKEVYQEPFEFVALLRLADRDGDGRVSEKEFRQYLDLQEKALVHGTVLTVADCGRTLFEFLDADHDGRLGPRELRSAWTRLGPWDRNGDGCITRDEIPRQVLLTLSQGRAGAARTAGETPGYGPALQSVDLSRGPLWFRKMDRNRDGDVSRREFLGTDEEFRRIDTDGDGFISVEEAEAADQRFSKRQR